MQLKLRLKTLVFEWDNNVILEISLYQIFMEYMSKFKYFACLLNQRGIDVTGSKTINDWINFINAYYSKGVLKWKFKANGWETIK